MRMTNLVCQKCGVSFQRQSTALTGGRGKFCSWACRAGAQSVTHSHTLGRSQSPTYRTWALLKQRCSNPNYDKYSAYGGRGLDYDPRWQEFSAFLADMGERPDGHTLDRIDNDRGYWPDNCRWATPKAQQRNRRCNVICQYEGRDWVLSELAEYLGLKQSTLHSRITHGWPRERWASPLNRATSRKPSH